ncbi:MAG: right-handed parallel beta-helix repeat-containing protein, partial [Thermoleophilia bacterium]|nr:right-handed parallel beta-helix repeat-containing protein [Thermoleophilia bacterium]
MTARLLPLALGAAVLGAMATPAIAAPTAGQVELRNAQNQRIGAVITGPDAIQVAEKRARTGSLRRRNDGRRWSIVIGRGTYGDFAVLEPNLAVRPARGATVTISGTGGTNNTRGGCIDVLRGGVLIQGLRCLRPSGIGVQVGPRPSARNIELRRVVVAGAGGAGISVDRVRGVLINRALVSGAAGDGIRLNRLAGTGPYLVQGGAVLRNGDDGVDVVSDVDGLGIIGLSAEGNGGNGIENDHETSLGTTVESSVLTRNRASGLAISRGTGHAVIGSQVAGNRGFGVTIGRGGAFRLANTRFNGTNRRGDIRFSPHARTGGEFTGLTFLDSVLDLPGDPVGVVVSAATAAQRAALTPVPSALRSTNRFIRVKDTGSGATSAVTLRYRLGAVELSGLRRSGLAVYEDDKPGNAGAWQAQPTSPIAAGGTLDATLADAQIASGADSRFATYAPLGPPDTSPVIAAVRPRPDRVVRGRKVVLRARVVDDDALAPAAYRLVVDGKVQRRRPTISRGLARFATRLKVGRHTAILKVTDPAGQSAIRQWRFRVVNSRPKIAVARALPRPNSFKLSRGRVTISVPV